MRKFGVHAFLLGGSWDNQIAPRVIAQAAELGFDLVEIPPSEEGGVLTPIWAGIRGSTGCG
jgi:hypothetical protein